MIQIFIVAFAIFGALGALKRFRQGRLPIFWLAFWLLFWGVVAVVGVLPQSTDIAARFVGVGRGADFAVYLSIIALFYLVFRLFVKIEDQETEITKLVRTLALRDIDKTPYDQS